MTGMQGQVVLRGGARSPSKKAMASPSPKAAASRPKGGKRSPTIEATASHSPKAAASSPKGGKKSPTKKATASPSQGIPGRNNKRKETVISPSAGSLQGKKRRGASPSGSTRSKSKIAAKKKQK
jgi:hypothetical protein